MALLSCSLQLVQVLTNTARWRWVERVLVPSPELPKKKGKSPKIYNLFSEVFLIVLRFRWGPGEDSLGGESHARNLTHKREQKAGQAAVERTTVQQ